MKFEKKRICITGIGVLSALGNSKSEVWQNLVNQRVNTSLLNDRNFHQVPNNFVVYKVKRNTFDNLLRKIKYYDEILSWKNGRRVIDLEFFLLAIQKAIDDSSLPASSQEESGLFLTHENPGIEQFCTYVISSTFKIYKGRNNFDREGYFFNLYQKFTKDVNDLQTFIYLHFVAKVFSIKGYSLFVNNSCASGLYAIEAAANAIKQNKCKTAIVASSECPAIYKYLWFRQLKFLSTSGRIMPFCKERDGFLCGEGATTLILEDLESAKARGAHIYAEYLGSEFLFDSWKLTFPNIVSDNYFKIMHRLISRCKIKTSQLDLICAHGLGAPLLDAYEGNSIKSFLGPQVKKTIVTSFKQYTGHTLGNSALLDIVLLLLTMEKKKIIPLCQDTALIDGKFGLNFPLRKFSQEINLALKSVWGFGGYNAATLLRRI